MANADGDADADGEAQMAMVMVSGHDGRCDVGDLDDKLTHAK